MKDEEIKEAKLDEFLLEMNKKIKKEAYDIFTFSSSDWNKQIKKKNVKKIHSFNKVFIVFYLLFHDL